MSGITNTGRDAESRFRKLTGALPTPSASQGDAMVSVDGTWQAVEIKYCRGGTLNQVRPIRFLPVAAFDGECWYAIPANRLVIAASQKTRGQHTEIPWESMTIALKDFMSFRVEEAGLARQIAMSIREDRSRNDLLEAMKKLRVEIKIARERARHWVEDAGPTQDLDGLPLFSE